jgi:hypothetical protein
MIINYLHKDIKLKPVFVKNMLFFIHIFTNKLTCVLTTFEYLPPTPTDASVSAGLKGAKSGTNPVPLPGRTRESGLKKGGVKTFSTYYK